MYAIADNANGKELIQNDLNNLIRWVHRPSWRLKMNFDKRHVIHFGHNNSNFESLF